MEILDHIFQLPDAAEWRALVFFVALGCLVWFGLHKRWEMVDEPTAWTIATISWAYAATRFLTDSIQEQGLAIYILWMLSLAFWRNGNYVTMVAMYFMKFVVFWYFVLP